MQLSWARRGGLARRRVCPVLDGGIGVGPHEAGLHRFTLTDRFEKCGDLIPVFLFTFIPLRRLQVWIEEQGLHAAQPARSHTGRWGLFPARSPARPCPGTGSGALGSLGHCPLHSLTCPLQRGLGQRGSPWQHGRGSWQLPETGLPSFSAEGFLLHQAHLGVVGAMRARGGEQCCCPIRAPQGEVGGSCLQEGCFGVLLPACKRSGVERRWKRLVGSRREFYACFSLPMAFSFSLSCLVPWFTCLLGRGQI